MNKSYSVKNESFFPLNVSAMLIIIIGIFVAILFKTEHHIFSSLFDMFSLHLLMYLLLFLSTIWLMIMLFESFYLSFGKLLYAFKWLLFFVYFPLGRIMSWFFRLKKEKFQTSFLSFQNHMFFPSLRIKGQARILVLLPHCLQFHDCKIRISRDISDCADCGECDICMLKDLGKKYDVHIGIANGGTLARKIVHDTQPDAIIAVACHRDLTDGVRESWNYPVYAILNERPYGPCYDTKVDVDTIEDVIKKLI